MATANAAARRCNGLGEIVSLLLISVRCHGRRHAHTRAPPTESSSAGSGAGRERKRLHLLRGRGFVARPVIARACGRLAPQGCVPGIVGLPRINALIAVAGSVLQQQIAADGLERRHGLDDDLD